MLELDFTAIVVLAVLAVCYCSLSFVKRPLSARHRTQSGNVFFTLFGAVALVGVVGAAGMSVLKGPVRSMHTVTQRTIAENNMIASAKLSIISASQQGDCDGDSTVEPIAFLTTGTGPKPTGGGYLPSTIGAALEDPWGDPYGYCVWDHGSQIKKTTPAPTCPTPANRLSGAAAANGPVVAILSAGPDRVYQTTCGNAPTYVNKPSGSDDIVLIHTYAEASALAAGLWNLKSTDPDVAEIKKDLEVKNASNAVVFGVDSTSIPSKPSIKVDYIKGLANTSVEYLSNIKLGSVWLSGDGANEGIRVNSDGEVGIGTASPAYLLDSNTDIRARGKVMAKGTGSYGSAALVSGSATNTGYLEWRLPAADGASGTRLGYMGWNATDVALNLENSADFIVNNGKVGIGGSPSNKLTVESARQATVGRNEAAARIGGSDVYTYMGSLSGTPWGTWIQTMRVSDGAVFPLALNPNGGNVGIGTTAPEEKLHVAGNLQVAGGGLYVKGGSPIMVLQESNDIGTTLTSMSANFSIRNNAGIGSATTAIIGSHWPLAIDMNNDKISMGGQVYMREGALDMTSYPIRADVGALRDADGGWVRTYGNTGWYSQTYGGGWFMQDTTWIRAYNDKNVFTPGEIRAGVFTYNSDLRLKENITPLGNNVLDDIQGIRSVRYNYKSDEKKRPRIGVIAQEVEKIYPEVVTTDPETGFKAVDYPGLVPVLLEAIKELKAQNKALAERVEKLEAK